MNEQDIIPVMFGDGVVVEDGEVKIFVACDLQSDDFNVTRLFFLTENGQWVYYDIDTVVASICVTHDQQTKYFALGRDGKLFWSETRFDWFEERISDAGTGSGKYGYLSQLIEIEGVLYACGHRGQVYRRTSSGWIHMDDGLLTEEHGHVTSHHAIDGTAPDNIYVAGNNGRVFYYNGNRWTDVSPDTNVDLLSLRCVSQEKVYVSGDNGLLYCGNHNGWELLSEPIEDASIWDIQEFCGEIYLVLEDKLALYSKKEKIILLVDTKLDPPIDAFHLKSGKDILWSFGEEDLAYFDGTNWHRVVHPHNIKPGRSG